MSTGAKRAKSPRQKGKEVEELPFLGQECDNRLVQQFIAQGGAPAFLNRAAQVQAAWHDVLNKCRRQRDQWLVMVRLNLAIIRSLAGEWRQLRCWLDEAHLTALQDLYETLQPELRGTMEATTSPHRLRRALVELAESIERFNQRWRRFLAEVDLQPINLLRDKYNQYYLLEKECIVGSPALARRGFEPLAPLTLADLEDALPYLPKLPVGN